MLPARDFSIISNNCWGGFMSQYFGLRYNSPFIGLFLFAPDYIQLLSDFSNYMSQSLQFIESEDSRFVEELRKQGTFGKYPIGMLGDIEIHFLHYKNKIDAKDKWNRRRDRINYNFLIIKFCDRDLATDNLIREFDGLNFKNKICLTAKKYELLSCIKLQNESGIVVENEWGNFLKTIDPNRLIRNFVN